MSEPMDEMQKHLAEAQAEIARLKDEITELIKHVQLGADHKKDPIWAMLKSEMTNQGYRKGYDQAMEKSHQLEDQLQKRSAELEQLLSECILPLMCRRSPRVTPPLLIYVEKRKKEGVSKSIVEEYLDGSRWHSSVDDPYAFVFAQRTDEGLDNCKF